MGVEVRPSSYSTVIPKPMSCGTSAPRLARDFTVVTPDLRGYGDSSKPPTTPNHEPYSKRAMANDQIAVMQQLVSANS